MNIKLNKLSEEDIQYLLKITEKVLRQESAYVVYGLGNIQEIIPNEIWIAKGGSQKDKDEMKYTITIKHSDEKHCSPFLTKEEAIKEHNEAYREQIEKANRYMKGE